MAQSSEGGRATVRSLAPSKRNVAPQNQQFTISFSHKLYTGNHQEVSAFIKEIRGFQGTAYEAGQKKFVSRKRIFTSISMTKYSREHR